MRARQYAPVCVLHGVSPATRRLIAASSTTFWQDRSALSAWLTQKHRQCLGGRKFPLAMLRQHRLDLAKQFRPRQQIEKRIRIAVMDLRADPLLLRVRVANSIMHSGWLLG